MGASLVASTVLGVLAAMAPRAAETPAAREQARLCESTVGEDSLAACRRAIQLGLGPARLVPVRQIVARRLAALERWEELAEHFREDVALRPDDAEARLKLGSTLLFGLGRPTEAEAAFAEAVRLAPDSALGHALLALCLGAGRPAEAAAEFEIAGRLDEHLFDDRPAMVAAQDAARRGEAWP